MKTILILGASGQVGQQLLTQALDHPEVGSVVAPSRRPLNGHDKLENPLIDYNQLPADASWWKADLALCALGTTLRQAGSRAGFYAVDHDYILASARLMRQAGTPVLGLVSSLGADPASRIFYLRVKGETERDIMSLGFPSVSIIRPSLLVGGPRAHNRPLEAIGLFLGKHLATLLPRRYRAVTTRAVAGELLSSCLRGHSGLRIIEYADIDANDSNRNLDTQ